MLVYNLVQLRRLCVLESVSVGLSGQIDHKQGEIRDQSVNVLSSLAQPHLSQTNNH